MSDRTGATGAAPPRKKPYVAPQLAKVELTPEEVVLGGCKTAETAAGMSGLCRFCGVTYAS